MLGFVWVKLPNKNKWKKYYARCQNSSILFCKGVNKNEFSVCYVIYNCNITTMTYRIQEWDNKEHQVIVIKHDFDSDCLLMALDEYNNLFDEKRKKLIAQSLESCKESMEEVNLSNRYSFGKIHLKVS